MKLGDIAEIQIGKTPPRSVPEFWGSGYSWLSISDLNVLEDGKYISASSEEITHLALSSTGIKQIPENTVLYSFKLSIGKVAITGKPLFTNEAIAAILIKKDYSNRVNPHYLFYALKNADVSKLLDHAAKGKTLRKGSLNEIDIPLPDLEIQNEIVESLDKIGSIIRKRKETVTILEKLNLSIFFQMFGDIRTANRYAYAIVPLSKVIEDTTYGTAKPLNTSGRCAILRMNNLTYLGNIELRDIKYADLNEKEKKNLRLTKGDILFNRTNSAEMVGKTAVWDKDGEYYYAGYLVRLRLNEKEANPYFVSAFLNSAWGKQMLLHKTKRSGNMANFGPSLLKKQNIFLPPIDLQTQYEARVKMVTHKIDSLYTSLSILERLSVSLTSHVLKSRISESDRIRELLEDRVELQLLLDKVTARDFETIEEYNTAKKLLFVLLTDLQTTVMQEYEPQLKSVELSFHFQ